MVRRLCLCALALAACGGGIPIEEWASRREDAFCRLAVDCGAAPDVEYYQTYASGPVIHSCPPLESGVWIAPSVSVRTPLYASWPKIA